MMCMPRNMNIYTEEIWMGSKKNINYDLVMNYRNKKVYICTYFFVKYMIITGLCLVAQKVGHDSVIHDFLYLLFFLSSTTMFLSLATLDILGQTTLC